MNLSISEQGIEIKNPIVRVFIPNDGKTLKRLSLPDLVIKKLQEEARLIDDQPRQLLVLLSDSGMRLSEACGLILSDLKLDQEFPHVFLKAHNWRSLKTASSKRKIPLVGQSLRVAKTLSKTTTDKFLFPKYCTREGVKANSAIATLNKWLKPRSPKGSVIHSFRHSLRDRLRNVGCTSEIIHEIGAWSKSTVGSRYAVGLNDQVKHAWISKIVDDNSIF